MESKQKDLLLTLDAHPQVDNDVYQGDHNLGRDEDDDCDIQVSISMLFPGILQYKRKQKTRHTDPLKLLAVAMAQLLFKDGEQVSDDIEALC